MVYGLKMFRLSERCLAEMLSEWAATAYSLEPRQTYGWECYEREGSVEMARPWTGLDQLPYVFGVFTAHGSVHKSYLLQPRVV